MDGLNKSTAFLTLLNGVSRPATRRWSRARPVSACSSGDAEEWVKRQAHSLAAPLGITLGSVVLSNDTLRVEVAAGPGERPTLQDCELLSKALDSVIDAQDAPLENTFALEVTTPGVPDVLHQDFEFRVFKGFHVMVVMTETFKGHNSFLGTLHGRDEDFLRVSRKGRIVKLPRDKVAEVRLVRQTDEAHKN